eukprot:g23792.t1
MAWCLGLLCSLYLAVAVPWEGEPNGRHGYELARALRQGFGTLDLGEEAASVDVLAHQNTTACGNGPQEHVNVLDTKTPRWSLPPCWRDGPLGPQRLMEEMQKVARWSVRAAAAFAPRGERWLQRALQEMDRILEESTASLGASKYRELDFGFALHSLGIQDANSGLNFWGVFGIKVSISSCENAIEFEMPR